MEWTGGCLCGAIRYRATTDPFWAGHCHCKNCQRWTGSAAFTCAFFAPGELEWTRGKPTYFQSSKNVQRSFCSSCGSPLGFHRAEHHDGVTAGTLDNPEAIKPEVHMFAEHEHAWAKFVDGLPRQEGFLPEDEDFDDPSLHE
jgi:hypothetical protein